MRTRTRVLRLAVRAYVAKPHPRARKREGGFTRGCGCAMSEERSEKRNRVPMKLGYWKIRGVR